MQDRHSFTLIELLIVIGILAILVAAVVVVLNPAQLLAQARDSKRQQDLSALNQALNTLQVLNPSPSFGTSSLVYISIPDTSATCTNLGLPSLPSGWSYACVASSTLQDTDGTGWIPVNFNYQNTIQLGSLPIDPINATSSSNYYAYATNGGAYEITSLFESSKYQPKMNADGGANPGLYEIGTNLSLEPFIGGLAGYWPFNGDMNDYSGNGNAGTIFGGVSFVAYKNGQAANFNGTTGYVTCGTPTSSLAIPTGNQGVTMSFWVYPVTGGGTFLRKGASGSYFNYGAMNYTGRPAGTFQQGDIQTTNAYLITSQWQHLVLVYTQPNWTVNYYYNGAFVETKNVPWTRSEPGTYPLGIGATQQSAGPATSFFSGYLSDVRVYNRPLSASEIQALYNATK